VPIHAMPRDWHLIHAESAREFLARRRAIQIFRGVLQSAKLRSRVIALWGFF
jgi:hypothetical protein